MYSYVKAHGSIWNLVTLFEFIETNQLHVSLPYNKIGMTQMSNKWVYISKIKIVVDLYLAIKEDNALPADLKIQNRESRI